MGCHISHEEIASIAPAYGFVIVFGTKSYDMMHRSHHTVVSLLDMKGGKKVNVAVDLKKRNAFFYPNTFILFVPAPSNSISSLQPVVHPV
jgi:hypothetical protein